ncbi:MAG TPA: cell division protein ZapA [Clostridia bacterium]|nr:cell division protein ZapA [Clostridia bacterium]
MADDSRAKKRVVVTIFDQEYVVKSQEEESYVQELASYLDRKMRDINRKSPHLSPHKVAVLTALNLVDELFKVQREYEGLLELIEQTKKSTRAEIV